MNKYVEKINLSLRNEQLLEKRGEMFINNIQEAAWENIPQIKRCVMRNKSPKGIGDLFTKKK